MCGVSSLLFLPDALCPKSALCALRLRAPLGCHRAEAQLMRPVATEVESHGTPSSAPLPLGCVMLRRPQPGDRFIVPDRLAILTVEVCHLGVCDNDGFTRFLVRAPDGSRWTLMERGAVDHAVRWIGTPLTNNSTTR